MTQANPGADMNLGEYPSIPGGHLPDRLSFSRVLGSQLTPSIFPDSRLLLFPTRAFLFPDSRLPFSRLMPPFS